LYNKDDYADFEGLMTEVTDENREIPRDKRAAFVRLAERRTLAVLDKIRILSNLSNRHVYDFYEEDVAEIFDAIQRELDLARTKFAATQRRRPEFSLSRKPGS
jgi:hypothetical protein